MEMPRSPLSSPRGKRRILVSQDSGPDPPKKSPIRRCAEVDHDDVPGPTADWAENVRRFCANRADPFSTGQYTFGGPAFASRPSDEVPESRFMSSDVDAVSATASTQGPRRPMLGLVGRGNSKDLMDCYFSQKRSRRRSSCKEITLCILPDDVCPATNAPLYRTVESRRRVSIAPQLSYEDVLEVQEPLRSKDSLDAVPHFGRSLSADAYDAGARQEARQETQALLFDSVPDLTDEENYDRFPTLRKYRRGAVCYDPDLATDLLCNLKLDED